jgi:ankyrin repeat protein
LHTAAAHDGSGETVKALLAANVDFITPDHLAGPPLIFSASGSPTPLIEAAKARDGKALRMLLEAGADVNAKDRNGGTALTEATVLGNADNVQTLLKAGANVNATVSTWKYTPLFLAIIQNNAQLVKTMLEHGADVNAKDSTGSTPLMWAAYSEVDDATVLKMLHTAGADINAKNHYGETALTWARRNGETALVRLLKRWGAQ